MEEFEKLLADHAARKAHHSHFIDLKPAQDVLINESFSIISDLLLEVQAASCVKISERQSVSTIISSLRSSCTLSPIEMQTGVPYITARLSALALSQIIDAEPDERGASSTLHELVSVMEELKAQGRLEVASFAGIFVHMAAVPLEVLFLMHSHHFVTFTTYIYHNQSKSELLDALEDSLVSCLANTDEFSRNIATELLAVLIRMGFSTDLEAGDTASSQDCIQVCSSVLDEIVRKTTHLVLSSSTPLGMHFKLLQQKIPMLNATSLKQFLVNSLKDVLTHKPSVPLNETLGQQAKWIRENLPMHLSEFFKHLLQALGCEDTLAALMDIMLVASVDWGLTLWMLSTYLICLPLAAEHMKSFVDRLLEKAFTNRNHQLLTITFLVARQTVPSYTAWFGAVFGSEARHSITSTNKSAFEFLIQFLTDAVPSEAPLYLRVHINKVPQAPPNCAMLFSDYIMLAKTRLKDLGEAAGGGLFGFELSPEEDVAQALSQFEQTGQVSRIVLDATLFRRQQYEEEFLPCLLKPRRLPSRPDVRTQFIAKLYTAGKIAHAVYHKYEIQCSKMMSHSEQADSPLHAESLDSWKGIADRLVASIEDGGQTARIEKAQSATAAMLQEVMVAENETLHNMAVTHLLDVFLDCSEASKPGELQKWPRILLGVLQPFPKLMGILYTTVQEICCRKKLQDHMLQGIMSLVYILDTQGISTSLNLPLLADSVLKEIQGDMLHCFRFCAQYLQHLEVETLKWHIPAANKSKKLHKVVPTGMLKKYVYLKERLIHSEDQAVTATVCKMWDIEDHPELWAPLMSTTEMSLQEWLEIEAQVEAGADVVSNRQAYIFQWLAKHYPLSKHEAASELLAACLQYSSNDQLVKELLCTVPLIVQHCGDEPWLPAAWATLGTKYRHHDIFRVVSRLPSWLLLSNHASTPASYSKLPHLVNLLSNHLKDGLTEQGFLLRSLVWYVLTGVSAAFPDCAGEALSQLIDQCPAFHLGLLVYARHLHSLLLMNFPGDGNCVSRVLQLVQLLMPNGAKNLVEDMVPWEAAIVLWSHGDKTPATDAVQLWLSFLRTIQFGNLLVDGSITVKFVAKDLIVTAVKAVPLTCSFPTLAEELLCNSKVLEFLNAFFQSENTTLFSGLSTCSRAAAAIGVAVLLVALPFGRLRALGTKPLLIKTLQASENKWLDAVSSTKIWHKLNTRYAKAGIGKELNLLKRNFLTQFLESIRLRVNDINSLM